MIRYLNLLDLPCPRSLQVRLGAPEEMKGEWLSSFVMCVRLLGGCFLTYVLPTYLSVLSACQPRAVRPLPSRALCAAILLAAQPGDHRVGYSSITQEAIGTSRTGPWPGCQMPGRVVASIRVWLLGRRELVTEIV